MDPPEYAYEYWRHYHSDCELVHVLWTDYCGMLHEKLVPADIFHIMYLEYKRQSSDLSDLAPLTVDAEVLITLPNGERPECREAVSFNGTTKLTPDYGTIQACIENKSRATVFASLDAKDPRVALKEELNSNDPYNDSCIGAAVEFQFVLRSLTNEAAHLAESNGLGQDILQELAKLLSGHNYKAAGLAIRCSEISDDGVITILPVMSDDLLTAVDNYYRIKKALVSITAPKGFRPSFFCALEDPPGVKYSGTPHDVMCENKLRCRLHMAFSPSKVTKFAAGLLTVEPPSPSGAAIYAFAKPNFLTYEICGEYGRIYSSIPRWMTWGIKNNYTVLNFPDGLNGHRLEFSDIDCMANMYLVAAATASFGHNGIDRSLDLKHSIQGRFIC